MPQEKSLNNHEKVPLPAQSVEIPVGPGVETPISDELRQWEAHIEGALPVLGVRVNGELTQVGFYTPPSLGGRIDHMQWRYVQDEQLVMGGELRPSLNKLPHEALSVEGLLGQDSKRRRSGVGEREIRPKFITAKLDSEKLEGVSAELVRGKPTKQEKQLKQSNLKLKLAALAGVTATVLASYGGSVEAVSYNDDRLTTATQLVNSGTNEFVDGVYQAEYEQDQEVLTRVRDAVAAGLAGDKESLKQQQETLGYEDNWIDGEDILAVSETATLDEAIRIAQEKVLDTLGMNIAYEEGTNLEDGREAIVGLLRALNKFSNSQIHEFINPADPIAVDLVEFSSKEKTEASGDYSAYKEYPRGATLRFNMQYDYNDKVWSKIASHELGHHLDSADSIDINLERPYLKDKDADTDSRETYINGRETHVSEYATTNSKEEFAELIESVFSDAAFEAEDSPKQERQMMAILALEKEMPGFAAWYFGSHEIEAGGETSVERMEEVVTHAGHSLKALDIPGKALILVALGMIPGAVVSRGTKKKFK